METYLIVIVVIILIIFYFVIMAPTEDVQTIPSVPTGDVQTIPSVPTNWSGKVQSSSIRCGPNHGNNACSGKKCCSLMGYCGGENGKVDDWCYTYKAYDGIYDDEKPIDPVITTNWSGKVQSSSIRCGPEHGNIGCSGKKCCSKMGYCGGENGKIDDWCYTYKAFNGKYDGEKPL